MTDIGHRPGCQRDCLVDRVGPRWANIRCESRTNPAVHRVAHPFEHRRPVTVDVEQHDRLGDQPELIPGRAPRRTRRPCRNPPGSTMKPSANSVSRALRSCIVGTTSSRVSSSWATSARTSCSVMTPITSPSAAERGVGDHAHQSDVAPAVDQPDAPVSQGRPRVVVPPPRTTARCPHSTRSTRRCAWLVLNACESLSHGPGHIVTSIFEAMRAS